MNYGNITREIICYNKNEQIPRIFFDSNDEDSKSCYEACLTSHQKGKKLFHNCIACEPGYRLKPEGSPKNN